MDSDSVLRSDQILVDEDQIMKAFVSARPVFNLVVTKTLINSLCELSQLHYDYKCKKASEFGGFLFGCKNFFDHTESVCELQSFDWDQIDTIMKITELLSYAIINPPEVKEIQTFQCVIQQAISNYRSVADSWNVEVG